jgi:uncharacterized membrane protein YgcG
MAKTRLLDRLLSLEDQKRLLEKIGEIEARSSGEVRLHLTDRPVRDALESARKAFVSLGMTQTRLRNGVLVFLSLPSRAFAVVGDEAVHSVAGPEYWEKLRDGAVQRFSAGEFAEGLLSLLQQVEEVLVEHFPHQEGDVDELPDEISFRPSRRRAVPWAIAGAAVAAGLLYLAWRLFLTGWS